MGGGTGVIVGVRPSPIPKLLPGVTEIVEVAGGYLGFLDSLMCLETSRIISSTRSSLCSGVRLSLILLAMLWKVKSRKSSCCIRKRSCLWTSSLSLTCLVGF